MIPNIIFSKKPPVPSVNLPLTLILLNTWILIECKGSNIVQHLHNQFTCDIKNLNKNQYSFSAHCNFSGKMISNMYVFYIGLQELAFIEPINIYTKQILEMKKYAVFSDITIEPNHNAIVIGIAGTYAKEYLNTFFTKLPNQTNTIVHNPEVTILHFSLPIERFLLIIKDKLFLNHLINKSQPFTIQYNDHNQWIALDIESGYPYIEPATSEIFIPQAANMDILQGISFNKGCYIGQELIARIHYRKLNQQKLYQLTSKGNQIKKNIQLPLAGDHVNLQINNKSWKSIGTVLQSCQLQNKNIWVQAILKGSVTNNHQLCIHNIQFNTV